jgi:hypothetical protein
MALGCRAMSGVPPTKSQVNKAGRILRKARDGTHMHAELADAPSNEGS